MILTIRCEHADRLLAERGDRRLRWYEAVAAHTHSSICRSCRKARRQLRMLRQIMAERAERGEPLRGLDPETGARLIEGLSDGRT